MTVAFDAKTSTITNVNGVATLTVSNLTVGSGANRAMEILLWFSVHPLPSGIVATWDSGGTNQAMTAVANTSSDNSVLTGSTIIYGLIAPTSGNKNLVVSWTGNAEAHAAAISFTGVNQTSVAVAFPNGNTNVHTTSTASPTSVAITSATGNMAVAMHLQNVAVFDSTNATTLAIDSTGPNLAIAANYDSGAATVTLTAAFSGPGVWSAAGNDVLAAGAATPGSPIGPIYSDFGQVVYDSIILS